MRQLFSVAKVQPQCRPQSELFAASGWKTVVLYPAVVYKAERGMQNCEYLCRCCSAALLELYSNCIRMQTKWKVFRISLVCTDLALSWLYSVFCFLLCVLWFLLLFAIVAVSEIFMRCTLFCGPQAGEMMMPPTRTLSLCRRVAACQLQANMQI